MASRKRTAVAPAAVIEDTPAEAVVRLLPVPGAYITGEPAVEREVTAAEADRLLSFKPPAYRKAPAAVIEVAAEPAEAEVPPIPQPPDIEDAPVATEPQE